MTKFNAENERIKRKYLEWEKEANGKGDQTIDNIRAALRRFEESTEFKSFKLFTKEQPIAFKKALRGRKSQRLNHTLTIGLFPYDKAHVLSRVQGLLHIQDFVYTQ